MFPRPVPLSVRVYADVLGELGTVKADFSSMRADHRARREQARAARRNAGSVMWAQRFNKTTRPPEDTPR